MQIQNIFYNSFSRVLIHRIRRKHMKQMASEMAFIVFGSYFLHKTTTLVVLFNEYFLVRELPNSCTTVVNS